eukprot:SAG22_NODE_175_length_16235_cov_67.112729_18_plen_83_part_00
MSAYSRRCCCSLRIAEHLLLLLVTLLLLQALGRPAFAALGLPSPHAAYREAAALARQVRKKSNKGTASLRVFTALLPPEFCL